MTESAVIEGFAELYAEFTEFQIGVRRKDKTPQKDKCLSFTLRKDDGTAFNIVTYRPDHKTAVFLGYSTDLWNPSLKRLRLIGYHEVEWKYYLGLALCEIWDRVDSIPQICVKIHTLSAQKIYEFSELISPSEEEE